jgi:hypothetical protein
MASFLQGKELKESRDIKENLDRETAPDKMVK